MTQLGAIVLVASNSSWAQALSPDDQSAIRANLRAYRDAWLKGDADAVMATLGENAVLLPSGLPPVRGEEAIRAFWWPAGSPPTKVLAMELEIAETAGESAVAYAWGRGSLTFSYQQEGRDKILSVRSTFMNVLRKEGPGSWKTVCRMWSDSARQ
jgi:ketosteroid isomerase-like protein